MGRYGAVTLAVLTLVAFLGFDAVTAAREPGAPPDAQAAQQLVRAEAQAAAIRARAEARAAQMRAEAEQLDQAGRHDEAERLRREAEQLAAGAREREGRPEPLPPERIERAKHQIEVLMKMAQMAEEADMPDVAHGLRQQAEERERGLREALQRREGRPEPERERAPARVEELRRRAGQMEERGQLDRARELRAQAERLEAEGRGMGGPPELPPFAREMFQQQEELRGQVMGLREEIRRLNEQLADLKAGLEKGER